jgi:hypothetical protein
MTFKRMLVAVLDRMPGYVCDPAGAAQYPTIGVIQGMQRGGGSPMRRRLSACAVLVVAACTALAACSSSGSSSSPSPGSSKSTGGSKTITIGLFPT